MAQIVEITLNKNQTINDGHKWVVLGITNISTLEKVVYKSKHIGINGLQNQLYIKCANGANNLKCAFYHHHIPFTSTMFYHIFLQLIILMVLRSVDMLYQDCLFLVSQFVNTTKPVFFLSSHRHSFNVVSTTRFIRNLLVTAKLYSSTDNF